MLNDNIKNTLKNEYNVSRETLSLLEDYVNSLLVWNKKINLIGKSTEDIIWQRHIIDSLRLLEYIPENTKKIIDIGTGAGIPGIIIALMKKCKIYLVDSDQRKCSFLYDITAKLNIDSEILNQRVEQIDAFESDIIISRAFASIDTFISLAEKLIDKTGFSLLLKGENVVKEIEEAQQKWQFEYQLIKDKKAEYTNIVKLIKK